MVTKLYFMLAGSPWFIFIIHCKADEPLYMKYELFQRVRKIKSKSFVYRSILVTVSLSGQTLNKWWIVFWRTGCFRLGESSFKGVSTNRLFCKCGWGTVNESSCIMTLLKKRISMSIV